MAGSVKRERQLARERYQRQQAKRAAARARRRRWQQVTAAVVSVLVVIGGIVGLTALLGNGSGSGAAAKPSASSTPGTSVSPSPSPSASPSGSTSAGGCTYAPSANKAAKDVGTPTYNATAAKKPYTATVKTNRGNVVIAMTTTKAPCTTNSFRYLATKGYYDQTSCHRLTTANLFVLQCGDPTGTGGGGPGYQFGVENAPKDGIFPAGTVAMARATDPSTNGSQFFVVYKETQLPTTGGGYTIFGKVTKGLGIVQALAREGVTGGASDG
ncbi:MAG: peptidyl-prolyl cis-trans isomerase, partial [Actinomycetota bacterium]|nr:peptidyl-prolyl cis-trans isomerase [Actinomycetota bacterium]